MKNSLQTCLLAIILLCPWERSRSKKSFLESKQQTLRKVNVTCMIFQFPFFLFCWGSPDKLIDLKRGLMLNKKRIFWFMGTPCYRAHPFKPLMWCLRVSVVPMKILSPGPQPMGYGMAWWFGYDGNYQQLSNLLDLLITISIEELLM